MKKVLVADDSSTILMLERMYLSKSYDVVTAVDGEEAVAKALAERPDLIILDFIMPKMDGVQACMKLRGLVETRDTPIVIVTTLNEKEYVDAALQAGATAYLTKPIRAAELLACVQRLLGE